MSFNRLTHSFDSLDCVARLVVLARLLLELVEERDRRVLEECVRGAFGFHFESIENIWTCLHGDEQRRTESSMESHRILEASRTALLASRCRKAGSVLVFDSQFSSGFSSGFRSWIVQSAVREGEENGWVEGGGEEVMISQGQHHLSMKLIKSTDLTSWIELIRSNQKASFKGTLNWPSHWGRDSQMANWNTHRASDVVGVRTAAMILSNLQSGLLHGTTRDQLTNLWTEHRFFGFATDDQRRVNRGSNYG